MEIPSDPNQWTLELVKHLVEEGYLETEYYEFKSLLTNKDDREHNRRLTRTACAFANTRSGFLIFGIRDMGNGLETRIEGISKGDDLANNFGQAIGSASPRIHFQFGNPPIKLQDSDKVIFIVRIPQSPDRPHMCDGQFYYRTNEGNRQMTYEQVRETFLQYEERRFKLKHLFVELLEIQANANLILKPRDDETQYPLVAPDTSALTSLLVDVYSLVQDDRNLMIDLLLIRRMASVMQNTILDFRATFPASISWKNRKKLVAQHNQELRAQAHDILRWTERCVKTLESKYGLKNPLGDESKL